MTAEPDLRLGSGATLLAAAHALPVQIVETSTIEDRLGLDRDWIVRRTGVERRHRAAPDQRLSDLCATAAERALDATGVAPQTVDLVLLATMTPDEPDAAARIASAIGASGATTMTLGSACSGFVAAVAMATGCIESGRASRIVVVGGDIMSRLIDHSDRKTAGIFGDGAGAVVMSAIDGPSRIGPYVLGSDGGEGDAVVAEWPRGPIRMDGHRTFKRAVDALVTTAGEAVRRAGITLSDIDLFVPHQANARITKAVRERLGLDASRVVDCISDYGNTTAGTIPIALSRAGRDGRLRDGTCVLITAFGAGLSWGGFVVTWGGG